MKEKPRLTKREIRKALLAKKPDSGPCRLVVGDIEWPVWVDIYLGTPEATFTVVASGPAQRVKT